MKGKILGKVKAEFAEMYTKDQWINEDDESLEALKKRMKDDGINVNHFNFSDPIEKPDDKTKDKKTGGLEEKLDELIRMVQTLISPEPNTSSAQIKEIDSTSDQDEVPPPPPTSSQE